MTKREMYVAIRSVVASNAEMVEFINHEIELLDRKATAPRKPSAKQLEKKAENETLKGEILAYLAGADSPKTIKEMQADVPALAGLTNQKITHLLTDLYITRTIEKNYVKKVPYFSAVALDADTETEEVV